MVHILANLRLTVTSFHRCHQKYNYGELFKRLTVKICLKVKPLAVLRLTVNSIEIYPPTVVELMITEN